MYQRAVGTLFLCRKVSSLQKKLKNRLKLVCGASAVLFSVTAGGVLLYCESSNFHEALGIVSQSKVIEQEKPCKPTYIYLSELDIGFENNGSPAHPSKRKARATPHDSRLFSWLQSRSRDPLTLLRLTKSKQHDVRLLGVQSLAAQHHWNDAQYLLVAQACDSRTLIGLARSAGVDPRFFLDPPRLPPANESLEDELRRLLLSLPVTDNCAQYITSRALAEGKLPSEEREAAWSFDGSGIMHLQLSMTDCLHALFTHSKVASHCTEIVRHNGLQVLQRIYKKCGTSLKICQDIARILSNIALHEAYHQHIILAGWVTILARWINSPDRALSMFASKALANLDRDFGGGKYADGIHLYHPTHRYSEPVHADVVFVHGIWGSPFITWRQKDPDPPNNKTNGKSQPGSGTAPEADRNSHVDGSECSEEEERTNCWPKDWLAKDYPHMRLLTLEYDTHLTEWESRYPFESQKWNLAHRSKVILQKLKDAGLGKRPIIWIGHSMGGLIIKNVLVLARNDPELKDIVDKSKGIVFYSVPHQGSPLAVDSTQTRYLPGLYPSVEVEELVQGSEMLTTLHQSFTELMFNSDIPLLSFGEGKKSDLPLSFKQTLVPPESSNPGFGQYHLMADMNHLEVCKPESRDAPLYQLTLKFIGDCIPQSLIENMLNAKLREDVVLSDMMN